MTKRMINIFIAGLIYIGLTGAWMSHCNPPTGDEPHYLLMAHSLVYDHDLDLKNNFQNKDYAKFYGKELFPQGDWTGQFTESPWYSHHSNGLPLLISLLYWLGGVIGVRLFVFLTGALYLLMIYRLALLVSGDRTASLWTWLICLTTSPLVLYSNNIATEMTSGSVATWAFIQILKKEKGAHPLLIGAALGALAWLHESNFLLSGLLFLVLVFQRRWKPAAQTLVVWAVAVAAALWLNWQHFGTLVPVHNLNKLSMMRLGTVGIAGAAWQTLWGMMGLMFDQEFGLLFYAPIFALTGLGFLMLYRDRRIYFWPLLTVLVPYYVLIASYGEWDLTGAANRYFVPFFFVFAAALAMLPRWQVRGKVNKTYLGLVVWGWIVAFLIVWIPWMRWNRRTGSTWILTLAERFIPAPLHRLVPSISVGDGWSWCLAFLYLGLIVWVTVVLARRMKRGSKGS